MLVKIDEVVSAEEISFLNQLSINIITIDYDYLIKTNNSIDTIKKIIASIGKEYMVCIFMPNSYIDNDDTMLFNIINQLNPNFIQFRSNTLLSLHTIKKIFSKNIKVIYEYSLDCDEDIYWSLPVFSTDDNNDTTEIEKIIKDKNFFIQLDIMSNYSDGWGMLIKDCGKYEDDLTISELNKFSLKYNTFVTFNFNDNNFEQIKETLPFIKGLSIKIQSLKTDLNLNYPRLYNQKSLKKSGYNTI